MVRLLGQVYHCRVPALRQWKPEHMQGPWVEGRVPHQAFAAWCQLNTLRPDQAEIRPHQAIAPGQMKRHRIVVEAERPREPVRMAPGPVGMR